MTSGETEPRARLDEFALIAKLFAPLTQNMPGAFALTDDVAVLAPPAGHKVVLKTDSLIEGVHFLRSDPPALVARKGLRRALSDLAAKGAEPCVYLLALALPPWPDMEWLRAFADGLGADQAEFGLSLVGGETNATPGPLTLTVTAVGYVPNCALIRRNGARAGDRVYVTGTIGDAGCGLRLATGNAATVSEGARAFLVSRYRLPIPRLSTGLALRGIASAALDVSDGLLADLGHVADVSGVRIEIDAAEIPLSTALRELWGDSIEARSRAAGAGDDYEIAFTAAAPGSPALSEIARRTSTAITPIGRVVAGHGVAFLDRAGKEILVETKGYTHY